MCGIGAVLNHRNADALLVHSLSKILHRGKKSYEIASGDGFALGANRLPIVDREQALQPCRNEAGNLLCVFNGEVYNYKKLRADLEKQGHKFQTDSDTETLVHLYEQYKERMPSLIDSESYAFVIYDAQTRGHFAARDPLGVKPLYWAKSGDSVYFASEMKQLAQFSGISEIMQVPPGHFLKDGRLERYSDLLTGVTPRHENADEIADKLRALLHEAVRKRVQTDLPVAVLLSGGLDSTSILSIARQYHPDVTAIIAGRDGSTDSYYARKYCEDNEIPFRFVSPPSEAELEQQIEKIVDVTETFEPNVIRNSVISYHISEAARDFRVILCGEGADELFYGYPEFAHTRKNELQALGLRFLSDLHRTQCQRVDRTSMQFTEEVRIPFLDTSLVEYAMGIPAEYKIRDGSVKWILRKAMEKELPRYICWRPKTVLSEGAGYKGNYPEEGIFDSFIALTLDDPEFARIKRENPGWGIRTREEAYYFSIFKRLGYSKGGFARIRPTANRMGCNEELPALLKSRKFIRHPAFKSDELMKGDLKFVMLWGALGKRDVSPKDTEAIRLLAEFRAKLEAATRRAARLTVVLADRHSDMDGFETSAANAYLGKVKRLLEDEGFDTIILGSLWEKWGLDEMKIRHLAQNAEIQNLELARALERASNKHFHGQGDGHKIYYAMRKIESGLFAKEFEGCVFLTYNGPVFREILPDMPTLYLRSRRGSSEAPWIP
jgi:asparagine synthase (glutamine-hydrolysing)